MNSFKLGDRVVILTEPGTEGIVTYVSGGEIEVEIDAGPKVSYGPEQIQKVGSHE